MYNIQSLLSARLFLSPQRAGDRIFFISNLSGRLSLYAMDWGGSVPEPLLPPQIALQNPLLMHESKPFHVFTDLDRILIMMDQDGDENYQPMVIPLNGGVPEPAFGEHFADQRVHLVEADPDSGLVYLNAESRQESLYRAYQANLSTGELKSMGQSTWGNYPGAVNRAHDKAVLIDGYTLGDHVIYLWEAEAEGRQLLYGTPMEDREVGKQPPLNAIHNVNFVDEDQGLLFVTALFQDNYGLGTLDLDRPTKVEPVDITGVEHDGEGELEMLKSLSDNRYLLVYNIDGASWAYEGTYNASSKEMVLETVLVGRPPLDQGVLQSVHYEKRADGYALSFSTAVSPTQIITLDGPSRQDVHLHTRERILGIPLGHLSKGEDRPYESFDGLRVSARLYLPAEELGYSGPRPLVYYLHGGPQGQERPDFAWFSMPLIQYLTLRGFAVFVPNVRGSTGYGLDYTKRVDGDWGGKDRLDHVHAMQMLQEDHRIDTDRAGVVGRSYGGYMTLTLAGRHPELWSAAVDMFGPYDLFTFMERIPETWKPYFKISIGNPDTEDGRALLTDRSPKTHLHQLDCPLLVIQGANDPRVVAEESKDLVEELRQSGKQVDMLLFEDEGHDVLKFDNRVRCYNAIADFFEEYLQP